jgi:hypothetical protein
MKFYLLGFAETSLSELLLDDEDDEEDFFFFDFDFSGDRECERLRFLEDGCGVLDLKRKTSHLYKLQKK